MEKLQQESVGEESGSSLEPRTDEGLSGFKLGLVMFALTLAVFLMLLDASIVATATPQITSEFRSLNDIGWYGTAYLLANCACQPLSGQIFAHFSVKGTFLTFFAIFEIGSALCGAAVSSTMLIIGRAVAGLGASGLLNGAYLIIVLTVPATKQAAYRGILMSLSFFGLLAGPLIGGALTEYVTWRWCFYINLPCGAVIAVFLLIVPTPSNRVPGDGNSKLSKSFHKLDLVGFLLLAPAVIMFILALQWGGISYSWSSATIIGLFCGAAVELLIFLVWERYVGAPAMIPLHLLRRRAIWSSCLYMAFLIGSTFTTSYYLPVYFQAVLGHSPVQSGVDMLPQILSNMVLTIFTGALVTRVGYYVPFALAGSALTSVGAGLLSTLAPNSALGNRIGYQILAGCQGLGFQIPILAVQHNVRNEEVSVATALVVFAQNLSGAVFLSLAQVIFGQQLRRHLYTYAPGADIGLLIASGAAAADVRHAVPATLLPAVRLAYSDTFDNIMYLATGAACATFFVAAAMKWVRVSRT